MLSAENPIPCPTGDSGPRLSLVVGLELKSSAGVDDDPDGIPTPNTGCTLLVLAIGVVPFLFVGEDGSSSTSRRDARNLFPKGEFFNPDIV